MRKRFLIYGHGGSYNHGGEAMVRCGIEELRRHFPNCYIILSSHFPEQDYEFSLPADEIIGCDRTYFALEKESGYSIENNDKLYRSTIERITPETVCIHLGGDNFCYDNWPRYANIHKRALERGARSVLWSCSIDPARMDKKMLEILRSHHFIAAREGITYRALMDHGITQTVQVSDLAFRLRAEPGPYSFSNYVSITWGPLASRREKREGIAKKAFQKLISYILAKTDMMIVLVPHVIMPTDNDCETMKEFASYDLKRISLVTEHLSAAQLKYIIGNARFCVTLRTHASIAAYSSCVPTLVAGYSMKSAGIAADLGLSDYVVQLKDMEKDYEILNAFIRLVSKESEMRKHLAAIIPDYIKRSTNKQMFAFDE